MYEHTPQDTGLDRNSPVRRNNTLDCCGKRMELRVGLSAGGRKETAIR
jgi:hypothetical protein